MSDEEILPCVMCDQHHQQMLMLTCMHDPCINCASVHYCSTQPSTSNVFDFVIQVYVCAKCEEYTELDSSSVVELQRVYNTLKGKRKYDYRRNLGTLGGPNTSHTHSQQSQSYHPQSEPYEKAPPSRYSQKKKVESHPTEQYDSQTYVSPVSQPYTPISQPNYNNNNTYNISTKKGHQPTYMCHTHPEEELSYFCFDCNSPICPECAIHGTHRDHEVQTTRKAIKTIKTNLMQKNDTVSHHSSQVVAIRDSYKGKLRDINEEKNKQSHMIKQQFAQLRNILNEKQRQFQAIVENFSEGNSNLVKGEINDCQKNLDQHNHVKKNIDSTMRKDDLAILQDYSKREKEANTVIQASKNKKYNDNLEGMKQIDNSLFKDEMDQLSGIIHGLKLTSKGRRN